MDSRLPDPIISQVITALPRKAVIVIRRAIIWSLGSLSVAILAAALLQLRMVSPIGALLQHYDDAIERIAILIHPLATAIQRQLTPIIGSSTTLYPLWPHLFLVFALQFIPRSEPFPGWDRGTVAIVKIIQGALGLVLALVVAVCIANASTLSGRFEPQFILLAAVMTLYMQSRAADWPIHVGTLNEDGMLPAFAPSPGDEPDESTHWSIQSILAAAVTVAFALAFLAVETGAMPEDKVVKALAFAGICICITLWLAWWLAAYLPEIGLGRLLGNPGDVGAARVSALSRLALLLAAAGLGFQSFTIQLERPSPDFLIDCALALVAMIFAYAGQRIHLTLVPPRVPDRDYPFPSATGIFLIGAALLFVIDNLLR